MFLFQPEASLKSQNDRIFYTQSISNETIVDFQEIDLAIQGLDETALEASATTKFGMGFGENKKWFLGIQRNFIKSANFNNDFLAVVILTTKTPNNGLLVGFYPQLRLVYKFLEQVVYRFGFRSEQMSPL